MRESFISYRRLFALLVYSGVCVHLLLDHFDLLEDLFLSVGDSAFVLRRGEPKIVLVGGLGRVGILLKAERLLLH